MARAPYRTATGGTRTREGLIAAAVLCAPMLSACAPTGPQTTGATNPVATQNDITYKGVQTRLLDGDLVNFRVSLTGSDAGTDVAAYAECAAAQYALIRGFGFARHVRTNVSRNAEIWQADAVYTISPALPEGMRTIDAEVVTANCRDNGIPTV